jgi:hypothetical protein
MSFTESDDLDDLLTAALRGELELTPEIRDLFMEALARLVLDDILRRRAQAVAAREWIKRNGVLQEQKERDRQERIQERKRKRRRDDSL